MDGAASYDAKDFLDVLLDAMEDENSEVKITRIHIKGLIVDFFTTGTGTTTTSVEWALRPINHLMVLEKAREEIDKVVEKHRLVQESDYPNLPYLQAIIKELFQLDPPVPLIGRKSIQDCEVNSYKIPAETLVFVNMWTIGRDPKNWENPLEFKPETFLQRKDIVDIRGNHFQLLPFGSGRRSCPGMPLAMKKIPTTLAAMIQLLLPLPKLQMVASNIHNKFPL